MVVMAGLGSAACRGKPLAFQNHHLRWQTTPPARDGMVVRPYAAAVDVR